MNSKTVCLFISLFSLFWKTLIWSHSLFYLKNRLVYVNQSWHEYFGIYKIQFSFGLKLNILLIA